MKAVVADKRAGVSGALAAIAIGLAAVSLTIGFGAVDLFSPWVLHEGTQVSDVGYGTLAGLVIPIGLLSQVRAPRRHLAGLQMVAAAGLAYLVAGLLAGERPLLVAAATVAAAVGVLVALHPDRRAFVAWPGRPSTVLLVLALAASAPGSQYALHMAFNQRNGVLPADAHLGLQHWAALTAAALAALLAALLAAFRTRGFAIPAFTACAATLAWATTCLVYPESAGALGRTWAGLAIAWAAVFALATARELRGAARAAAVGPRRRRSMIGPSGAVATHSLPQPRLSGPAGDASSHTCGKGHLGSAGRRGYRRPGVDHRAPDRP